MKITPATRKALEDLNLPLETADDIRGLVNALWAVTHDGAMSRDDMLDNLALLSGMAINVLIDYAQILDDDRIQIIEA